MFGRQIPGANLLLQALRLIEPTPVRYYFYMGHQQTPARVTVPMYRAGPLIQTGNLQPVDGQRKLQLGLQAEQQAWTWRVNWPLEGPERGPSWVRGREPDIAVFTLAGRTVVCEVKSTTPWGGLDGWNTVLLIETGKSVAQIPGEPEPAGA